MPSAKFSHQNPCWFLSFTPVSKSPDDGVMSCCRQHSLQTAGCGRCYQQWFLSDSPHSKTLIGLGLAKPQGLLHTALGLRAIAPAVKSLAPSVAADVVAGARNAMRARLRQKPMITSIIQSLGATGEQGLCHISSACCPLEQISNMFCTFWQRWICKMLQLLVMAVHLAPSMTEGV